MNTKVAIIILNWNRGKDTLGCLQSIKELTLNDIKTEVVVVDNASTDGSASEIKKFLKKITFDKSQIKGTMLKNKENLGFAAGNNVGISYALQTNARYIMLLNNDTLVDKNLLVDLLLLMDKFPKAGAMSPKIYFAPGFEFHKERYDEKDLGNVIWYAGGEIDWDNVYGSNNGVDEIDKGQFDTAEKTDFVTGACVLFRSEAIKKAGSFDPKYFMYLEDVDLSMRMSKTGYNVMYAPPAHMWHKVAQSSKIGGELNDYFLTRNRLLFGMMYARPRTKIALIKESFRLLFGGRKWQRYGVKDFYLGKFGKGSWKS